MNPDGKINQKNFGNELILKLTESLKLQSNEDLEEIKKNAESDLFANISGHFSEEDLQKLLQIISEKPVQVKNKNDSLTWRNSWEQIVDDYHHSKYWGISLQKGAPSKLPLTEQQKNTRELWSYIWILIQSSLILKIAIYYFGIRAAEDQDPELKVYMYGLMVLSVFLLSSFVYRKWRREK